MVHLPQCGKFVESLTRHGMNGGLSGVVLPAPDCDIDIQGIDFDAAADASDTLGGQQSCAGPEEGIENNLSARRAIENCVRNHSHRFYGWVQREEVSLAALLGLRLNAGIVPDIGSVPSELSQLDIVPVWSFPLAKYQNQFVLRAIKTSHAAVVFDPHAHVEKLVVVLLSGGDEIGNTTPVDAEVMNRVVCAVPNEKPLALP